MFSLGILDLYYGPYSPPASPSMYVMVLCITAVFKKPLSWIRKPFSVSFSGRSPGFAGAFISLKAVAAMALSLILSRSILQTSYSTRDPQVHSRYRVRLSSAVVAHCQRVLGIRERSLSHGRDKMRVRSKGEACIFM